MVKLGFFLIRMRGQILETHGHQLAFQFTFTLIKIINTTMAVKKFHAEEHMKLLGKKPAEI